MKPYYVTTAITYPNGDPHVGHAYEYIATDAIARFKRLDGFDVRFLTGTDEHGLKMVETAAAEGIPTAELAQRNSDVFQRLQQKLNISFDRFIRTTDADHHEASKDIWRRMQAAGDIYLDTLLGLVLGARRTVLRRVGDRGRRRHPDRRRNRHAGDLDRGADLLLPALGVRRQAAGALRGHTPTSSRPRCGATRWSASSPAVCGICPSRAPRSTGACKVPDHPDHVMYVWVDALTNYLTGVGYPDTESELFQRYWPADLHMIGKDIIRFHTVYWPAFLMSAGIDLPRRVFAHGFLFNRGEKMSKSVGNIVDPNTLIDTFGVDQVRYFLLREVPFGQDGSYSEDAIITRINTDLANELGNLAQRSLSMVAKNLDGVVPTPGEFTAEDTELLDHRRRSARAGSCRVRQPGNASGAGGDLADARRGQQVLLGAGAVGVAQERGRGGPGALRAPCSTQPAKSVRIAALLIQPVMPDSAGKLLDLLGQSPEQRSFAADRRAARAGHGAAGAHRRLSALSGRLSTREANPDRHAPVLVAMRDGMSGLLDSVECQRQWSAVAEEVAPPGLGVGHVRGDLDLVTATAVGHRNAERASRTTPGVGDHVMLRRSRRPRRGEAASALIGALKSGAPRINRRPRFYSWPWCRSFQFQVSSAVHNAVTAKPCRTALIVMTLSQLCCSSRAFTNGSDCIGRGGEPAVDRRAHSQVDQQPHHQQTDGDAGGDRAAPSDRTWRRTPR